jgi:hypothetical protein
MTYIEASGSCKAPTSPETEAALRGQVWQQCFVSSHQAPPRWNAVDWLLFYYAHTKPICDSALRAAVHLH